MMIKCLGTDSERAIAYKYTMLAFNLAHKLTQDAKNAQPA